jgi:hypothetical protein
MLLDNGIHLVTGIKSSMKNRLTSLRDRILLRKRSVMETINDELKNICRTKHSRHRSLHSFVMNLIARLLERTVSLTKNLPFSLKGKNQPDS